MVNAGAPRLRLVAVVESVAMDAAGSLWNKRGFPT